MAYMTVEEIADETGLSQSQVRGVLYAIPVKPRIQSKRINKKMRYTSRKVAEPAEMVDFP